MATLQIRKKSLKVWLHVPEGAQEFIVSKFYAKIDGDTFKIVEDSGSNRKEYDYADITVYDDTDAGSPEIFPSPTALMLRLEELKYVGFNRDGDIPTFTVSGTQREEFEFAGGSQIFTLSENFDEVLSIEVQGQGALKSTQYTITAPNQFEILDTLETGEYIVCLYNKEGGDIPVTESTQVPSDWNATSGVSRILNKPIIYTQTQTNSLLLNKVDKVTGKGLSTNDLTDLLKASYDNVVLNFPNKEDKSNKQDSLSVDGTGTLYPTVDAVNEGLINILDDANTYADGLITSIYKIAGNWDASGNTFPTVGTGTGGVILAGNVYRTTVAGTPVGFAFLDVGDQFYALVDSPGQTASNWSKFEANTEQATESIRGTSKVATGAIVADETSTNDIDFVTTKKLWLNFVPRFLALAWTWALKQTFTTAPRFSSVTASQYLKVDASKDLSSVANIPSSDITGDFAQNRITNLVSDLAAKAPLASPTFTGTVNIPTAAVFAGAFSITGGSGSSIIRADGAHISTTNTVRAVTAGTDTASSAIITSASPLNGVAWQLQNQLINMTAYIAKTATYTATALDSFIDCTSGTFTVTLPTAVGIAGKRYTVKNSGAGVITIATTSSQTIDGAATKTLSTQYSNFQVISDGANWKIVSALP